MAKIVNMGVIFQFVQVKKEKIFPFLYKDLEGLISSTICSTVKISSLIYYLKLWKRTCGDASYYDSAISTLKAIFIYSYIVCTVKMLNHARG